MALRIFSYFWRIFSNSELFSFILNYFHFSLYFSNLQAKIKLLEWADYDFWLALYIRQRIFDPTVSIQIQHFGVTRYD